ncbi:MAG TPA: NAD(P)-dependent oxidoreductase [Gaiellaceae bacterium]|nr:NAD(P)-dependent oxidoreductase [Gaiellaceae bacterium]
MTIGFVGFGSMGQGIVRRLLAAGRDVVGWNRTRARAEELVADGLRVADSLPELAREADVVFSMLTNAAAVEAVVRDALPGLAAGTTWLDLSTIAPDESRAIAALVEPTGGVFLDAPVSGSPATVAAGQLSIMVGGDRAAFDAVEPVLLDMGPKVSYLGPQGSALVMKFAINLSLVVQGMSFCESVAMAEKAGIEREAAVDAVLKSVIASPMLGYRGPMILDGRMPETPFADVPLQQKDQELGLRLAQELGTPLPFATLANQFLTATAAAGLGEQEWIAAYEVFRRLGGSS